jgi:UDP-N-acetylglucosamine 2-epimerase (non-hydrolysing)
MMQEFNIPNDGIALIDPVDFFSFLQLESSARLILTDSGGVQEESCIIGKPCVTLRDNTERPETVDVGANMVAGTQVDQITHAVSVMFKNTDTWENPFGDGTSGKKILNILEGDNV